jgi:hypothetical protein
VSSTFVSGKNYRDPEMGLMTRFRFWLIGKLAGRAVVIVNAELGYLDEGAEFPLVEDVNGGMFINSSFRRDQIIRQMAPCVFNGGRAF